MSDFNTHGSHYSCVLTLLGVGYGGDQVGYEVDEDCLALNIIRPAGGLTGLAVAVWIHGYCY